LSRGSSRRSPSTTPPRVGSSSTTPPPSRVRVPRHFARLVTRLVAPLIVDYSASRRLIVDYFASTARPGASARRAACHAARRAARRRLLCLTQARRRLLRLAQARRRLLRLRRASGCLGMSRGSSRGLSRCSSSTTPPRVGSSSTTSPTPCVWVPQHVAWLIARRRLLRVTQARRTARCAARPRLLHLRRASGCLGTSRGSSRGSSSTTPCAATSFCGHSGSTLATPCVATTCLAATLALLRVRHAPPQRRLPVASCRPFISTSFPN
jgi:hypothetical protein